MSQYANEKLRDQNIVREKEGRGRSKQKYRLPDNNEIELGSELFEAPEVLFNPEIIGLEYAGVPQTLVMAIQKADLDIRKTLYGLLNVQSLLAIPCY